MLTPPRCPTGELHADACEMNLMHGVVQDASVVNCVKRTQVLPSQSTMAAVMRASGFVRGAAPPVDVSMK